MTQKDAVSICLVVVTEIVVELGRSNLHGPTDASERCRQFTSDCIGFESGDIDSEHVDVRYYGRASPSRPTRTGRANQRPTLGNGAR